MSSCRTVNADMECHQRLMASRCRICADKLSNSTRYEKSLMHSDIFDCFGINIGDDCETLHPNFICKDCKRVIDHYNKSKSAGRPYSTKIRPFEWTKHPRNGRCNVCSELCKGGKKRQLRGRTVKVCRTRNLPDQQSSKTFETQEGEKNHCDTEVLCNHARLKASKH